MFCCVLSILCVFLRFALLGDITFYFFLHAACASLEAPTAWFYFLLLIICVFLFSNYLHGYLFDLSLLMFLV